MVALKPWQLSDKHPLQKWLWNSPSKVWSYDSDKKMGKGTKFKSCFRFDWCQRCVSSLNLDGYAGFDARKLDDEERVGELKKLEDLKGSIFFLKKMLP